MLASDGGRDLAWQLIRDRWNEIQAKTGGVVGNPLIVAALSNFCSDDRARQVEAFFAGHPVPDADRTLALSLERIRSCAAVSRAQAPALRRWLEDNR